jgi:hypothetical protein
VLRKSIYQAKTGTGVLDAVEDFFAARLTGTAANADLPITLAL